MTKSTPASHVFSGFFALRTPLLPLEELYRWAEGLEAPRAAPDQLEAAIARDRVVLRERLRAAVSRPEVREALFLASPPLDESLPYWEEKPESDRGEKAERTLVRYFSRMASRSTPFGLFAGCSIGRLGDRTSFKLEPRSAYMRHTRIDSDYVNLLSTSLEKKPEVRRALVYQPNTSLYSNTGRLRYAESRQAERGRSYELISVEPSEYLVAVLEAAKRGATFDALLKTLTDADSEVTREEAEEYLHSLIDTQILVSDLALGVTGLEPVPYLIDRMRRLPGQEAATRIVDGAQRTIEDLDRRGVGLSAQSYRGLAQALEALEVKVELPRLFQVDMVKPVQEALLGPELQKEILRGISIAHRCLGASSQENPLGKFRDQFRTRYEEREIPLYEALDEESGIGFDVHSGPASEGSPLLQGLQFSGAPSPTTVQLTPRMRLLLAKIQEAVAAGKSEAQITEAEIDEVASKDRLPLPDAFAVMGAFEAPSVEAIQRGDFRFLLSTVAGPSGANLLGRFCHGNPELTRELEKHIGAEEALQSDAVYAEIVHLPEGRMGNILARPILRAHEIVYLGRSGVPAEKQILLGDLMVSVRNNEVVLRSKTLNRRVIPRMTSAHNFARGPGPYRFLNQLASQGTVGGLSLNLDALDAFPFIPRISCGRVVLSLATWYVQKADIESWTEVEGAERFRRLQDFRKRMKLPRVVLQQDFDNELPVDFDNVASLDSFVQLVKSRDRIILVEPFPARDGLLAEGPEGRFNHEVIVPLVRRPDDAPKDTAKPSAPPPAAEKPASRIKRSFPPGSEWLYAKIFVGTGTADRVLEAIHPMVREALDKGLADRFFFIRYGDPDWHLRVRFHGDPTVLVEKVHPLLTRAIAPLFDEKIVWRVQTDTYEREVERYGGAEGIALSEELFGIDSEHALEMVALLSGEDAAEARWQVCFAGLDRLLGDLGLDLADKQRVLARCRQSFGAEFRVDGDFERRLGEQYRSRRKRLDVLLDPTKEADDAYAPGFEVLARRSVRLREVGRRLREAESAGRLNQRLVGLAGSYLHMHANRMLRSAARQQELVLYDFLLRSYESLLARAKKGVAGSVVSSSLDGRKG